MKIEYDKEVDALTSEFREKPLLEPRRFLTA